MTALERVAMADTSLTDAELVAELRLGAVDRLPRETVPDHC